MRVVVDIECNGLVDKATHVWCVVCKDVDTGKVDVFRQPTTYHTERERFLAYAKDVTLWIGHNWLGYDYPVLNKLVGLSVDRIHECSRDTLVLSRLIDYSRERHSIEHYGEEFGSPKITFTDFSSYSPEMEEYCKQDVEICHKIFVKYSRYINDPARQAAIHNEQLFQLALNDMERKGFGFNRVAAEKLLADVTSQLSALDEEILKAFPPRQKLLREFTPRATKFGTISKTSVPRSLWERIHEFEIGKTYPLYSIEDFNPGSVKQIVTVLNEAGWKPEHKTKTHIQVERELGKLTRSRNPDPVIVKQLEEKLVDLKVYGWKINEDNLETLPATAPPSAKTLAKRITVESRRKTLTEWLGLYNPDTGRIHGSFYGIGAWTHRMSHQKPNLANIPNEFDTANRVKYLGKELRSLWIAPKNRLLCGVDAEAIQLRIFAHYIDDPEFTQSLVTGKKSDKTDPHSFNQRVLGDACKSRQAAKRFIFALLLGAGIGKLAEILECDNPTAQQALDRLLLRYAGFKHLKEQVIPKDAERGWFLGLDGRAVRIIGDTVGARRHLAMSGYLQNGEAVVMKIATTKFAPKLSEYNSFLVDLVHDEWQTETPNDFELAKKVCQLQCDALEETGRELNLKCPLAGSYWNDDHNRHNIGRNWYQTH